MKQKFFLIIQLVLVGFLISSQSLFAQQQGQRSRTISGIVTDENGEPLPGAYVAQKRVTKEQSIVGVMSDIQGHFSLTIPGNTLEIEVAFLGFETQVVVLTENKEYAVKLKTGAQTLDEVVVTGMFTRKANSYTGAVSTVKKETLLQVGNQNIVQSLKNLDPSFIQLDNLVSGSNPNAAPNLQMRGQSAFPDLKGEYQNNPNQPLFILDGFETSLTKIIDLDMNMVESITLLKDATAKAIYGSKAANGVIVMETRRPESGRMKISYNGSAVIEAPDLTSYDLANAAEKIEIERLAGLFDSDRVDFRITRQKRYNEILKEVLAGVNTDWLAQPVRTGIGQKHALYLEGGDKFMLYGVDLSFNNINGVMKGSDRNTFSGGLTLSYRIKGFIFRNKLSITHNSANESPWGSFATYAIMNPYSRIYNESGQLIKSYNYTAMSGAVETQTNPIWNSMINTKEISRYTDITNNFYAEWAVNETFKLTGRVGFSSILSSNDSFMPASHTSFVKYEGEDIYRKGYYMQGNGTTVNFSSDLGANYSLSLGKSVLFLNGQWNMATYSNDNSYVEAEGFPNDNMDHIIFATQYRKNGKPGGSESISRSLGGIVSANYAFDNRFLFDANYRITGSSEFGANNRWGSFWSLGGGWNVHEEKFLKNSKVINRLKLRVSTGYTGSQGFSTYQALATVKYYTTTSYFGNIGSYLVSLANPNLQWQKKYDQNAGLDITMFKNRLTGRFDIYTATTTSMLTDVTVPQSTGFSTYRENLGETVNKGFEGYINYRIFEDKKTRSFLNIYASVANNVNKINKISESLKKFNDDQDAIKEQTDSPDGKAKLTTPSVRYVEGQSLNAIWAVRSLGIDPANGKEIFVKKNGEVTYIYNTADQVVCGDLLPKFNGNFGLSAEIRNIGINLSFGYRLGGQIYNSTLVNKVENADIKYNVDRRVFTDRWQVPGDYALYKSIRDLTYTKPTSRFVEDYDVLTLSSVNLSYDFRDSRIVKNSFLERLKIQFYANDLFTFSTVKVERGTSYPFARNFTFSIQAAF
ncbi:MAG: SusC/RagA family TonB-linked outer membrane protein [Bacteroidales bacterium]